MPAVKDTAREPQMAANMDLRNGSSAQAILCRSCKANLKVENMTIRTMIMPGIP